MSIVSPSLKCWLDEGKDFADGCGSGSKTELERAGEK